MNYNKSWENIFSGTEASCFIAVWWDITGQPVSPVLILRQDFLFSGCLAFPQFEAISLEAWFTSVPLWRVNAKLWVADPWCIWHGVMSASFSSKGCRRCFMLCTWIPIKTESMNSASMRSRRDQTRWMFRVARNRCRYLGLTPGLAILWVWGGLWHPISQICHSSNCAAGILLPFVVWAALIWRYCML